MYDCYFSTNQFRRSIGNNFFENNKKLVKWRDFFFFKFFKNQARLFFTILKLYINLKTKFYDYLRCFF